MKKFYCLVFVLVLASCGSDDAPEDTRTQAEIDAALIEAYLEENDLTAQTDPSGVRYIINSEGNGLFPAEGKRVFVDYEVFLLDGTFIDTSLEQTARDNNVYSSTRTYRPFDFVIGNGGVIDGFDIATRLLSEEGTGTFFIPSEHAYRGTGNGAVPPNAVLLFNLILVDILD